MKRIEIKNLDGDVIFAHESEDNTFGKTLTEAIKAGANLHWGNLFWNDLRSLERLNANSEGKLYPPVFIDGCVKGILKVYRASRKELPDLKERITEQIKNGDKPQASESPLYEQISALALELLDQVMKEKE